MNNDKQQLFILVDDLRMWKEAMEEHMNDWSDIVWSDNMQDREDYNNRTIDIQDGIRNAQYGIAEIIGRHDMDTLRQWKKEHEGA